MKRRAKKQMTVSPLAAGGLIVVAVLLVAAWWWHGHSAQTALVHTPGPSATPTPPIQGPGKTGSAAAGPQSQGAVPSSEPSLAPNPSHPVSYSMPAPTLIDNTQTVPLSAPGMESTCQSEAGAVCYIRATMGSTVKQVTSAQPVSSNAGSYSVILNWNADQLSPGTWTVVAVATLNGQTAVSAPWPLKVTQ